MKAVYFVNILFCLCLIFVVYYEGLDMLLDDRLNIDNNVHLLKSYSLLAYIIFLLIIITM